ncbi:hypothetical protein CCP3SC15_150030 [Gammaproteobacteria bacterium]
MQSYIPPVITTQITRFFAGLGMGVAPMFPFLVLQLAFLTSYGSLWHTLYKPPDNRVRPRNTHRTKNKKAL